MSRYYSDYTSSTNNDDSLSTTSTSFYDYDTDDELQDAYNFYEANSFYHAGNFYYAPANGTGHIAIDPEILESVIELSNYSDPAVNHVLALPKGRSKRRLFRLGCKIRRVLLVLGLVK